MKIALVVNPFSGRKFNREAITTLRNRLLDNHQVEDFSASSDEELDEVGKVLSKSFDVVIICGGDGTVSRICSYLIDSDVPLIVYPTGSGNDFANHLNMTNDVNSIIKNIEKLETKKINTISINDGQHHSLTISCFAFEAKVNRIASTLPRFFGRVKYTVATFVALLGKSHETVNIQSSAVTETNSYSLAILANAPSFGGGMIISNKAHVEAEDLYLILVNKVNKLRLIYLFLLLLAGKHYERPEFRQYPVKSLKVKGVDGVIRAQSDGDSIGTGDFTAKMLPKSLTVLVCN
ncbi:MAG: diacylglycerol kinase family protein [Actinobacteria bacterium]|nr:diacylglycerol kinase family protein [Actinomycetota bacterium]